jgi:hypothetical protein
MTVRPSKMFVVEVKGVIPVFEAVVEEDLQKKLEASPRHHQGPGLA